MENLITLKSLKSFVYLLADQEISGNSTFLSNYFFFVCLFAFSSVPRNIAWGQGTNRYWQLDAMIESNILGSDWKNNYYCIYCSDMLKNYQGETKLLEFSRDANREELRIGKNDVTLQWLRCNVFHFFIYRFKATIFVDDDLYGKCQPSSRTSNHYLYEWFHNGNRAMVLRKAFIYIYFCISNWWC